MQLALLGPPGHAAHQRDAVVVGVAAHEDHAARDHLLRVDVRDPEAEHLRIEVRRALQVGDSDHDVTELLRLERQVGRSDRLPQLLDVHHRRSTPESARSSIPRSSLAAPPA
jgi:hypothetical protein